MFCVVMLTFIVRFGLINPLWDGEYINFTMQQYKRGPIVQIKMVEQANGCDEYSMSGAGFPEDGSYEFEVVG